VFCVSLKVIANSSLKNTNNNFISSIVAHEKFSSIDDNQVLTSTDPDVNYPNMTQLDTDKIKEIVNTVSDDAGPISKITKQEIADLFAKYKMTDEDIKFFKLVGPGFIWVGHDVLFFTDALESLKKGTPIKSDAQKSLEEFGLSYNTMTSDQINTSDEEIEKISRKEPALNTPSILTENDIKGFLNYSIMRATRVDALFNK